MLVNPHIAKLTRLLRTLDASLQKMFSNIGALFLLTTTPFFVQYLETTGQDKEFSFLEVWHYLCGNFVAWSLILVVSVWAIVWLKIPSSKTYGPVTDYNVRPEYQDNGCVYYVTSIALFLVCQWLWPQLSPVLFWNMPYIVGALNTTALILCIYMCAKGLISPEYPTDTSGKTVFYLFYSGVELHPRLFGIYIKQATNGRIGLLLWQLLIIAFFITGQQRDGFNSGLLANCVIQTVYLAKFYHFEHGYFWTLDIMYDRAGYYLCWGCLVFVPSFYTYSTYYLVLHPSTISDYFSFALIVIGVSSLLMNYRVDYEKLQFQRNRFNSDFKLWGRKVKYITVTYKNSEGEKCESRLLVSGCWGVARHMNYFFELITTLCWSLAGFGYGLHTFLYFFFLAGLMLHRCYRDEDRCYKKYGNGYEKYCKQVPYRIIPFVF